MSNPVAGLTLLGTALKQRDQQARKAKALGDLYWFATEILGYDKLSATFHAPMLAEWDRQDAGRFSGRAKVPHDLNLWPRDHIKTWCERARVLRYYLRYPDWTHTWWHAVEEMACESAVAVGKSLQFNKELRKFFDQGILPSPSAKKFVTASGFSLRSNKIGDAPSMRAWGAGSEATGGHSRGGTLDDVIGFNDVVDSQMPAKSRWFKGTVMNVIRSDGSGWLDHIATRWDREDLAGEHLRSPNWRKTVRAALETDGKPDYKGEPVYLTADQIRIKREEMGETMFAYQMMNDASPAGDRPWSRDAEITITLEEAKRPGTVVILSDPAPARVGSGNVDEKKTGGEKDYWATCAVKLRQVGQRREIVLLDGQASRDWTPDEGWRVMMRMAARWSARHAAIEAVGQAVALYQDDIRKVARDEGAKIALVDLSLTYQGKNEYFSRLCDALKTGEFLIAPSVPEAFLEMFLQQAREWRPIGKKNNLKFDDCANVVSFATDPEVRRLGLRIESAPQEWSPYMKRPEAEEVHGSRRVQW